jgi:hypothetical protein
MSARAQDLALDKKFRANLGGTTTYWQGLSKQNQSVLAEGGFDPGTYNDFIGDNTRQATLLEDPAFYLSVAVSGGAKLLLGLVSGACVDGNCGNEAQALSGTSTWPAPWSGPQTVNGINYSKHALERMAPVGLGGRGVPPSAVENALSFGASIPGKETGVSVITYENVRVVWNYIEEIVITVIKLDH